MSTTAQYLVSSTDAASRVYDVVVVGAGIAGSVAVRQLANAGKRVLVVEAGAAENLTLPGFQSYVQRFYGATDKNPNAPFPANPNAPSPTEINDYFVETGPMPLGGSYTRALGGTTLHWEGKTPRMLREDLELRRRYGVGLDWPISYDELIPLYERAEYEIGVSGNAEEQRSLGIEFSEGYVFPMLEMPPSFLDETVRRSVQGMEVDIGGTTRQLRLTTYPQGRNGIVNPEYRYRGGKAGYKPTGVVHDSPLDFGLRCQGNANCVPLCPVQAKYDARKTLAAALSTRSHLHTGGSGDCTHWCEGTEASLFMATALLNTIASVLAGPQARGLTEPLCGGRVAGRGCRMRQGAGMRGSYAEAESENFKSGIGV
jgi:choline dehydrogenase-like flavoprotein